MIVIRWRIRNLPKSLYLLLKSLLRKCRITCYSLTYNHFLDSSYAADVCMEPMFWFVDNFASAIGPMFVVAVGGLTSSVVFIAYWIGLPYWWNRNPYTCIILLIIGHWLLINICFHYYMAVITPPGFPPQGEIITEAVSICKKCIAPKPPRTHHCSVCNRCILKMDHHCPWLNNCVGYKNHRYFFMYMFYMIIGVFFVIVAGFDIGYDAIMSSDPDEELEGHSVKYNNHTGTLVMVTADSYIENVVTEEISSEFDGALKLNPWKRRAIIYMVLINTSVFIALGTLTYWHSYLIQRGETSIEANINKAETKRFADMGKVYVNPYNFGVRKNWRIFLGLVQGRTFIKHIVFPSSHQPTGDGLTWHTVHDEYMDEWP